MRDEDDFTNVESLITKQGRKQKPTGRSRSGAVILDFSSLSLCPQVPSASLLTPHHHSIQPERIVRHNIPSVSVAARSAENHSPISTSDPGNTIRQTSCLLLPGVQPASDDAWKLSPMTPHNPYLDSNSDQHVFGTAVCQDGARCDRYK